MWSWKTLDHVLFHCPTYDRDQAGFHKVCSILGIEFDIQTIFTRKKSLPLVEESFLSIADNWYSCYTYALIFDKKS